MIKSKTKVAQNDTYNQIPTTLYKEDDDNWIRIDIARKKLSHLPNIKEP